MWQRKKNICTKVTNQNFIHKGMKNRLNPQNICYHSVLNILPPNFLFKSHTDQTPPAILYACKILFHVFKEQRLRVSENRVPGKLFLTKWQKATGNWDSCTMRSNRIIVCSFSHIFFRMTRDITMGVKSRTHWNYKNLHKIWSENTKNSGSQSVIHRSQGICDQFPEDQWVHSCNGHFELYSFSKLKE